MLHLVRDFSVWFTVTPGGAQELELRIPSPERQITDNGWRVGEYWGGLSQLGGQTWRAAGRKRRKELCHLSLRGCLVGLMRSGWTGEQRASGLLGREFLMHQIPCLFLSRGGAAWENFKQALIHMLTGTVWLHRGGKPGRETDPEAGC